MSRVSRRFLVLAVSVAVAVFGLPLPASAQSSDVEPIEAVETEIAEEAGDTNNPIPASSEASPVLELWSKTSRTFEQPDGTYETEVFAGQVNFRDESGDWAPIDNSLSATQDGEGWQNTANDYSVELPSDLDGEAIEVQENGSWVSYELHGASADGSKTSTSTTYEDALPGVDVRVEASNEIVKEDVILSGPESPSTFTYEIAYSDDVVPQANGAGGIDFVRSDGHVPFFFAAPYMTDSSGTEEGYSDNVEMALSQDGSRVTVTAGRGWLEDPAREWPVTVDPSVGLDGPYDDAWINSAAPTTVNDGSSLKVGPGSDGFPEACTASLQWALDEWYPGRRHRDR